LYFLERATMGDSPRTGRATRFYMLYGKRLLDLCLAAPAFVLLSPLLGITALLIRNRLGAPVLYRQQRPGRFGKPFTLVKFRSLTEEHDSSGQLLPDAERLTRLGRFLRDTSLDELPELWNVLSGDMSLVGPRPLLMQYLERYTPTQARRHDVPPGLTGWAQVNGRNALTWEQKFGLDLWYVEHISLTLDIRILLKTIIAITDRRGISQPGYATMEEFKGNNVN
jgi:sugar transferase EpsL